MSTVVNIVIYGIIMGGVYGLISMGLTLQYGVGKIVALSGTGVKRSATVQFAGERTLRRFRLAFSPLRPARE